MTEINFYVSKEQGLEHRMAIAFRLVNRALERNLKIHIHTDTEATSKQLDDYLWSKESTSFIPHSILNTEFFEHNSELTSENTQHHTNANKVDISHDFEPLKNCDYLINLSNQRPAFFSRFLKVAEIIDNDEEIITAGRKRYSFYRDRGYTLGYYQL